MVEAKEIFKIVFKNSFQRRDWEFFVSSGSNISDITKKKELKND